MTLKKKPFVRNELDENRVPEDKFTLKLDKENGFTREFLNEWKEIFDIQRDSTVTKRLALVGAKVILSSLGKDFLKFLLNKDRVRWSIVSKK